MKAPPHYLNGHVLPPEAGGPSELLADGAWCGHGEPDFSVYDIHDSGERALSVLLPSGDYPALCAAAAFREGHEPFFLYDPRHHPASVYENDSTKHPFHPSAPHECDCGSQAFRISVGFEVPGDSEAPEDTSWFAMAVQCVSCGKQETIFDDETA